MSREKKILELGNQELFPKETLEDLGHVPNYNNWVLGHFTNLVYGRTAEIGAGLGTISGLLRPNADRLDLIEPSPNLAAQLRLRFASDERCHVIENSIEAWLETSANNEFDCILMVNVLEHIRDDEAAVRGIYSALKPGGHFLVFVPALPFLFSKLDEEFGHFRRYTRRMLATCVENGGFRIRKLRYFDISGVLPWWLLNTVLGKTSFHQPSLAFYDRFVVPPTKLIESIVPPPLGKNLVLVASKQ